MREGARGIQSIEVSGRILGALVQACEPMILKDIAQAADIAPAQCHAYLTSLKNVGLVHQDNDTGNYRLGPFAMRLAIGWLQSSELSSAAIWSLKALTDETGLMSVLTVWGTHGPTIIHINAGSTAMALNLRQGTLFSVTGTASGRIFGAFGKTENISRCIDVNLSGSSSQRGIGISQSREEFEMQLKIIRQTGYSIADGAPIPGINAVSAPIFDSNGVLAFGATLIGPTDTLDVSPGSSAVKRLIEVASAISSGERHSGGELQKNLPGGKY